VCGEGEKGFRGAESVFAGRDGQIIIRDRASNSELARWVVIADNDYAVVTPDGYYFSTRAGRVPKMISGCI
jgi:hypothetical protein